MRQTLARVLCCCWSSAGVSTNGPAFGLATMIDGTGGADEAVEAGEPGGAESLRRLRAFAFGAGGGAFDEDAASCCSLLALFFLCFVRLLRLGFSLFDEAAGCSASL